MGMGRLAGGGRQSRARGVVGWLAAIVVAIAITVGVPAGTWAEGSAAVAAPQLNLRAEPGTWAPVVGQLWQGERLALLAGPTPDDWYHVQAGDQTGWAFGGLLAFDGASDALGQGGLGVAGSAERWVDVDRTRQMVTLYEGDSAVATYWAAMGSDPSDDGFFATAVGTYWVYEKYWGLSWTDWGGAWVDDWIGFDPTRLNGFHTYLMDAAGQVIPGGDGPTGGCVALAPTAADQLFAFVSVGTRVEVHD
jgi:L,D-transpeptidase catalytic domain/Bacterial SH3 domain